MSNILHVKPNFYQTDSSITSGIPTPEQAIKRVAQRVMQGGHYVPEDTIRRRYIAGLKNTLKHYLPLADTALILDNSLETTKKIIARKSLGQLLVIEDSSVWTGILKAGHGKVE